MIRLLTHYGHLVPTFEETRNERLRAVLGCASLGGIELGYDEYPHSSRVTRIVWRSAKMRPTAGVLYDSAVSAIAVVALLVANLAPLPASGLHPQRVELTIPPSSPL